MFFIFFVQHGSDHRRHFSERRNLFLPLFSSTEQTKSPRVPDLQQQRQQQQWKQQDTFKITKMYMHTHVITKHLRE